ncbi:hypothetical protein ACLOJK_024380 [Asimina triloba]
MSSSDPVSSTDIGHLQSVQAAAEKFDIFFKVGKHRRRRRQELAYSVSNGRQVQFLDLKIYQPPIRRSQLEPRSSEEPNQQRLSSLADPKSDGSKSWPT